MPVLISLRHAPSRADALATNKITHANKGFCMLRKASILIILICFFIFGQSATMIEEQKMAEKYNTSHPDEVKKRVDSLKIIIAENKKISQEIIDSTTIKNDSLINSGPVVFTKNINENQILSKDMMQDFFKANYSVGQYHIGVGTIYLLLSVGTISTIIASAVKYKSWQPYHTISIITSGGAFIVSTWEIGVGCKLKKASSNFIYRNLYTPNKPVSKVQWF